MSCAGFVQVAILEAMNGLIAGPASYEDNRNPLLVIGAQQKTTTGSTYFAEYDSRNHVAACHVDDSRDSYWSGQKLHKI